MPDNDERKMGTVDFSFYPSGENSFERHVNLSFEVPPNCSIGEFYDCCKKFMLALGFSEKTVEEYFGETVWDI